MAWFICDKWDLDGTATNDSYAIIDTAMYEAARKSKKEKNVVYVWQWSGKGTKLVKAIATAGRCVYVEACHCGRKAGCTYCDSTGWKECG